MLQLTKNQLVTDAAKNQIEVRQMEVDWYCSTYSSMSYNAALLAGFAFSGLTTDLPEGVDYLREFTYMFLLSTTMGMMVCTVILSTFLSVWAPSLALRGKNGTADLHKAIYCLHGYQKWVFGYFVLGWVLVFLSSIVQVWIYHSPQTATAVTVPLAMFIVLIIGFTSYIYSRLALDSTQAVQGKIQYLETYEHIGDLDHEHVASS